MPEISTEHLANGLCLTLTDDSRELSGGRWLVRLRCEARMAATEAMWQGIADQNLASAVRERFGGELFFSSVKERNFIAAAEREAVLAELRAQVEENILPYLARPETPARLFRQQFEKWRLLLTQEEARRAAEVASVADEKEPADFSFLFKKD